MLIPIYAFLPFQGQKEFILCRLVGNFWTPLSFILDEPLHKKTKADTFYTTSSLPYPVIETPYTRRYDPADGIIKVPFNKSEYEKGVNRFIKELYANTSPSSTV